MLRVCLLYAEKRGYLLEAPEFEMVTVEAPNEAEQFLSEGETALFLDTCARVDTAWHPFFVVAFRTGLRVGELIALQAGDADLAQAQLHVRRRSYGGQVSTPKSGRVRTVPMPPSAVEALHPVVKGKPRDALLFAYPDGTPYDRNTPRAHIRHVARACGLREFGIHQTRHSYASHLVQRGVSLEVIARLLGQSSPSVAARYSHLGRSALEAAVAVLP